LTSVRITGDVFTASKGLAAGIEVLLKRLKLFRLIQDIKAIGYDSCNYENLAEAPTSASWTVLDFQPLFVMAGEALLVKYFDFRSARWLGGLRLLRLFLEPLRV